MEITNGWVTGPIGLGDSYKMEVDFSKNLSFFFGVTCDYKKYIISATLEVFDLNDLEIFLS